MTAIVGVLCRDGLVIGADSATTFGASGGIRTIEQRSEKLHIIHEAIIVAGTGQVGLAQRFNLIVEDAYTEKIFSLGKSKHQIDVGKELCKRGLADFVYTSVKQGSYGALVGFTFNNSAHLCEFATTDFQPEFKDTKKIWYCSMGSGQLIIDPFLALIRGIFWSEGPPTVQDATFAVTWALDHAVEVNPGGVNAPVRVAVMERADGKMKARLLEDDELAEHRQNIEQAKERLKALPKDQAPDAAPPDGVPKA